MTLFSICLFNRQRLALQQINPSQISFKKSEVKRERETNRERDRQTDRQTNRETARERDRQRQTHGELSVGIFQSSPP